MVYYNFTKESEKAVKDMERLRQYASHAGLYASTLLKWIVVGGLVGGVGGLVGALFHLGVNYATELRQAYTKGFMAYMAENPGCFDPKKPAKEGMREITELVKIRMTNLNSVGKAE